MDETTFKYSISNSFNDFEWSAVSMGFSMEDLKSVRNINASDFNFLPVLLVVNFPLAFLNKICQKGDLADLVRYKILNSFTGFLLRSP